MEQKTLEQVDREIADLVELRIKLKQQVDAVVPAQILSRGFDPQYAAAAIYSSFRTMCKGARCRYLPTTLSGAASYTAAMDSKITGAQPLFRELEILEDEILGTGWLHEGNMMHLEVKMRKESVTAILHVYGRGVR